MLPSNCQMNDGSEPGSRVRRQSGKSNPALKGELYPSNRESLHEATCVKVAQNNRDARYVYV